MQDNTNQSQDVFEISLSMGGVKHATMATSAECKEILKSYFGVASTYPTEPEETPNILTIRAAMEAAVSNPANALLDD